MTSYSFLDDYSEGCHPAILERMAQTNLVQQTAYGDDEYSIEARKIIRTHLGSDDIPVFFVAGGTLANIIITSCSLRSHEAVISANSGHIVVRETVAIEATGHKIITVPSANGKLSSSNIEAVIESNAHFPHMTRPRLVYISNASEAGTIYSKAELQQLSKTCKANNLLLLLDGARLGVALTAPSNDLTLKDIAELTDVFWIGGTKAGALIGEAIAIPNRQLADDFSFHIKQRGALLAKGRLLGLQFVTLFSDNLFFTLTAHANTMAQELSKGITGCGHSLSVPTQSNQVFPVLPDAIIEQLKAKFDFYVWQKLEDERSIARLVTSWATDESQVECFIETLGALSD